VVCTRRPHPQERKARRRPHPGGRGSWASPTSTRLPAFLGPFEHFYDDCFAGDIGVAPTTWCWATASTYRRASRSPAATTSTKPCAGGPSKTPGQRPGAPLHPGLPAPADLRGPEQVYRAARFRPCDAHRTPHRTHLRLRFPARTRSTRDDSSRPLTCPTGGRCSRHNGRPRPRSPMPCPSPHSSVSTCPSSRPPWRACRAAPWPLRSARPAAWAPCPAPCSPPTPSRGRSPPSAPPPTAPSTSTSSATLRQCPTPSAKPPGAPPSPLLPGIRHRPQGIPSGPGRSPFSAELADTIAPFRPPVVSFHFGLPAPRCWPGSRLGRPRAVVRHHRGRSPLA
jgi:hypothetical protein